MPRSRLACAHCAFSRAAAAARRTGCSPPIPSPEKAKLCATCHGEQGIPINKQTPVIWGQNEGYLYLQLRDFKSGARKNALMSPIAATAREGRHAGARRLFLEAEMAEPCSSPRRRMTLPPRRRPQPPRSAAAAATSTISRATAPPRGSPANGRIICKHHDGLPRRLARQQSRHVGSDEGDLARRHRRAVAISRRAADRRNISAMGR